MIVALTAVFILLFCVSAFFSCIEAALFSLSRIDLSSIDRDFPKAAALVRRLLFNPAKTVNAIVIGNNLANVSISVISASLFWRALGGRWLWLSVIITTVLLLVLGEIVPKIIAISAPRKTVVYLVPIFNRAYRVLLPMAALFEKVSAKIIPDRLKQVKPRSFSDEELEALMDIAHQKGAIHEKERVIIERIFDLDERTIDEIMVPRVDLIGLDIRSDAEEFKKLVRYGRDKIFIYKNSIDHIIGYVSLKKVLFDKSGDWHRHLDSVIFVPETKNIFDLLLDFKEEETTIAVIVDEYGGIKGAVFLENVVEAFLGDIKEEFEPRMSDLIRRSDGVILVNGRMQLYNFEQEFGLALEDVPEDVDTVAGLALTKLGRLPESGERFILYDWIWEIEKVKDNRIELISLRPKV